ncbi:MAG: hypothetical protein JWP87_1806, partial [Labilithrix sp.]|nr:hypothetical protein [Labilithrix sp.]
NARRKPPPHASALDASSGTSWAGDCGPRAASRPVTSESAIAVGSVPELIVGLMGSSLPESIADVLSIPSALTALRTSLAPGTVDPWRAMRAVIALGFVVAFATFLVRRDAILVDEPEVDA